MPFRLKMDIFGDNFRYFLTHDVNFPESQLFQMSVLSKSPKVNFSQKSILSKLKIINQKFKSNQIITF